MESLYAKLYNKYTKLKREKESEFDELNHAQEVKFLNYATAADEMIQHLKLEIETLHGQIEELTSELNSLRSSSGNEQPRVVHAHNVVVDECPNCSDPSRNRAEKDISNGDKQSEGINDKGDASSKIIIRPACSSRTISDSGSFNCVFQDLFELVHGLKVSLHTENDELSALAHHSSGYTFSLTWTTNPGGETELLYRVISMGTIERIAPEWMKEEAIRFSPNMCNIFFERVSRVLKA